MSDFNFVYHCPYCEAKVPEYCIDEKSNPRNVHCEFCGQHSLLVDCIETGQRIRREQKFVLTSWRVEY